MRSRGELPPLEEALLGIERPSPEEQERAEKRAAEERELRAAFLKAQMANPLFRQWLFGWLQRWGTFENIFASGPTGFPDPSCTMFKQGEKSAGWDLWTEVDNLTPELSSLMRREGTGKA